MTRSSRQLIGKLVFLMLVALSGYALAANGDLRNPFTVIGEIVNAVSGEQSTPSRGTFPAGEGRPARPEGDFAGRPGEQTSIQWNEMGSVLFDLWFIAAAAAVVMIISHPLEWVRRRPRIRRAPSA